MSIAELSDTEIESSEREELENEPLSRKVRKNRKRGAGRGFFRTLREAGGHVIVSHVVGVI